MACPAVPFGIPEGAKEINLNTGREMFRCGDCLKVFISNVTMEISCLTPGCKSPAEVASIVMCANGNGCVYNVTGRWRDRTNVVWKGKDNATASTLNNGQVLTCLDNTCGSVYLYSEKTVTVRVYADVATINQDAGNLVDCVNSGAELLDSLGFNPHGVSWQGNFAVTDVGVNLSRNDWQSMNITGTEIFQRDPSAIVPAQDYAGQANWNNNNGLSEIRETTTVYDDDCTQHQLENIFSSLYNKVSC